MRKVLFSLLLATAVATPALAQSTAADRAEARQERKAEREKARENRADARQERSQAREERSDAQQERAQVRQQRVEQRDARVESRAANVNERGRPTLGQVGNAPDSVAGWRRAQRETVQQRANERQSMRQQRQAGRVDVREQRQEQRAEARQQRQESRDRWVEAARAGRRLAPPQGARPDRPAPLPTTAYNRDSHTPSWDRNWRNNHHYDWRNYRNQHRSIFHLGFYYDPFGWGYRRYNVGWRLWPSYYNSNYWLNDPAMYALPYAPWPYRWVRYYDDALLVNTFTGQVVDVMYDYFW